MGKVRNIFAVHVGRYTKQHLSKESHLHPLKPFGMKLLIDFLLPESKNIALFDTILLNLTVPLRVMNIV